MTSLARRGLFLACLALPAAARAEEPRALDSPVEVRVELLEGRAEVVRAGRGAEVVHRARPVLVAGATHLEVRAASRVRIAWLGRASLLVSGPASLEWTGASAPRDALAGAPEGERLEVRFFSLGAADAEVRRGELAIELPAGWTTTVGAGAFQLAPAGAGTIELRHHAGPPIELQWLGETSAARPPIRVPAGSSVRLDRPRYSPAGAVEDSRRAPWEAERAAWPWRARTDRPSDVDERVARDRATERFDELPGAPGGRIRHVRVDDGEEGGGTRLVEVPRATSRSWSAPRLREGAARASVGSGAQPARVEVSEPVEIRATVEPPPIDGTQRSGAAPAESAPAVPEPAPAVTEPPSALTEPAQAAAELRASAAEVGATPRDPGATRETRPQGPPLAHSGASDPRASRAESEPSPTEEPASESDSPPALPADPPPARWYDAAEWRGVWRERLQGSGAVAVERLEGVDLRLLPAGRVRVLVSATAARAVWCFTPSADFLLSPGSTVVFEPDGATRLRLGACREHPAPPGRPAFSELAAGR